MTLFAWSWVRAHSGIQIDTQPIIKSITASRKSAILYFTGKSGILFVAVIIKPLQIDLFWTKQLIA